MGNSAGSRVLLGIMDKTAETGEVFKEKTVFHTNHIMWKIIFHTLQMAKLKTIMKPSESVSPVFDVIHQCGKCSKFTVYSMTKKF